MVNVKKKGNAGENHFANWLRDNGIKAWRDSASGAGTREKGDIGNNIDCTFEVKTVKRINLQQAWRQVEKSASIHHNKPVLVIHFDGMPKDEWLIVQHSEDWLNDTLKSPEIAPDCNKYVEEPTISRSDKQQLQWLSTRVATMLKEIDKILAKAHE